MKIKFKEEKEKYGWKFSLIINEAGILDYITIKNLFFSNDYFDSDWQELLSDIEGCCFPSLENLTNNSFDLIFLDEEYELKEHLELFLIDNNLQYES